VSTPPSAQPLKVVAGRDSYAQHPRRSRSAAFFAAALMTLAAGLVIGIARGYTNVQLPWLLSMTPSEASTVPASPGTTVDTLSSGQGPAAPQSDGMVHTPKVSSELEAPPPAPAALAVTSGTSAAAADAAGTGSLDVSSEPAGAIVALDGRVVGQTPLVIRNVPQGTHVVGIEAPGLNRWAASVDVTASERTRVTASLAASRQ